MRHRTDTENDDDDNNNNKDNESGWTLCHAPGIGDTVGANPRHCEEGKLPYFPVF